MQIKFDIEKTPSWEQTKKRLLDTVRQVSKEVVSEHVIRAQAISIDATIAAFGETHWNGEALTTPPERRKQAGEQLSGPTGLAWVQTVVETLAQQYGINIRRPGSRALIEEVANILDPIETEEHFIMGYASRSRLDKATQYEARIMLRNHLPTNQDRGRESHNQKEPKMRPHPTKPQLLWWNWDEQKWQSASIVGFADGSSSNPFGRGRARSGWRGKIPGGSGYWADQEFGTMGNQVSPRLIPKEGESFAEVYLSARGAFVSEVREDPGSIRPVGYLAYGARTLYTSLYADTGGRDVWLKRISHMMDRS